MINASIQNHLQSFAIKLQFLEVPCNNEKKVKGILNPMNLKSSTHLYKINYHLQSIYTILRNLQDISYNKRSKKECSLKSRHVKANFQEFPVINASIENQQSFAIKLRFFKIPCNNKKKKSLTLKKDAKYHRLRMPNKDFFQTYPKCFGLFRPIGHKKMFGIWRIFGSNTMSAKLCIPTA